MLINIIMVINTIACKVISTILNMYIPRALRTFCGPLSFTHNFKYHSPINGCYPINKVSFHIGFFYLWKFFFTISI